MGLFVRYDHVQGGAVVSKEYYFKVGADQAMAFEVDLLAL